MSTNRLYHTWFKRIRQLHPSERVTRLRNFVWLMVGTNALPISIPLCPVYSCKLSGS